MHHRATRRKGHRADATSTHLIGRLILLVLALQSGPYRWAVAIRSSARRAAQALVHLVPTVGSHASGDVTVTWIRRHLDILRIGGAVATALALLVFSVDWVGFLIIAALLVLYELGLHRLRQRERAALSPAPTKRSATSGPAAHGQGVSATEVTSAPAGPDRRPGSETTSRHVGHTSPLRHPSPIHPQTTCGDPGNDFTTGLRGLRPGEHTGAPDVRATN
jgi:hypothetical protein